jgi:hypothetical protein
LRIEDREKRIKKNEDLEFSRVLSSGVACSIQKRGRLSFSAEISALSAQRVFRSSLSFRKASEIGISKAYISLPIASCHCGFSCLGS